MNRLWWLLGAVIVATATYFCLIPGRELPGVFEWNDKLSHLAGHGLLALYFSGLVARRGWWKIFLLLVVFGIAIEFTQYYMHNGREGDPRDVVANTIGVLIGLAVARLGGSRWPQFAAWVLRRGATE